MGTTHVVFERWIARLASLVPKPRASLTRFHGVFAPNSTWRAQVTLAKRSKSASQQADKTAAERVEGDGCHEVGIEMAGTEHSKFPWPGEGITPRDPAREPTGGPCARP